MIKPCFSSTGWIVAVVVVAGAALGIARFSQLSTDEPVNPLAESPAMAPSKASSSDNLGLPPEEREYIWQIEHHGLVLNKFGFKPLAECIARLDLTGIANRFGADFQGQLLHEPREVRVNNEYAQIVRQQDAGRPPLNVDRAQLLERLLEFRHRFKSNKPPKAGFNLITLSPVERGKLDGLWAGTCLFRIWGETAPGQPAEVICYFQFRIERPTEERLAQPGWLHFLGITQSQVAQATRYLLRDATKERGIDAAAFHDNWLTNSTMVTTGGVFLCDFDRDGILDMLITDVNRFALYKGKSDGTFEDVTVAAGLPMTSVNTTSIRFVAAFVDIDGDGWEDLILGNQVYRNEKGRFVNYTQRTNLRIPTDAGGIVAADYDRDGRVDLYVVRAGKSQTDSWLDGKSGDPDGNQLWRNLGNWQFEEVSAQAGVQGGHRSTFSAAWLDANNDGWPDLYVIHEFGNGVLLVNQGNGTFREQLLATGPADFGTMGVACGDIDNDGNIDIYTANMYSKAGTRVFGNVKPGFFPDEISAKFRSFVAGSQLWRNRGQLNFEPIGKKCQVNSIGWAYGADLIDLDNDGWLDLYATAGFISKDRTKPDG